jgi:hypothetical protein
MAFSAERPTQGNRTKERRAAQIHKTAETNPLKLNLSFFLSIFDSKFNLFQTFALAFVENFFEISFLVRPFPFLSAEFHDRSGAASTESGNSVFAVTLSIPSAAALF